MTKIAIVISWLGGVAFTYVWLMRVGKLRDQGMGWIDATIKKNDLVLFGFVGLSTLVAMVVAS
ncbi:hypothetical protein D3OALGA1CA_2095 [Olavius algarvensis associated proteobacterium Delta 3]|nr:hypothetical protein D3OALGA1CA_2095 [Olavius algarvensis associated proteobacterium Delta 3]CAB5121072.1 hypothetical protein D3OALGB2SA_2989 [Olavius algarvensis associated proteobacterium Delta 3]